MASSRKEEEKDKSTMTWYAGKSEKYNGREYYYNPKTNESTWILPDELHPNPNECTYTPSSEGTDRDYHHEDEDDALVNADGSGGDTTRHPLVMKKKGTNFIDENQTNRNIGRAVGVLMSLLAICAIMHTTWSFKEDRNDVVPPATGEEMIEQKAQQNMQQPTLVEAEMVKRAINLNEGLAVEEGESTKSDAMGTRADISSETDDGNDDNKEGNHVANRKPVVGDTKIIEQGQETADRNVSTGTSTEDDAASRQSQAPIVIQTETSTLPTGEDPPADESPISNEEQDVQEQSNTEGGTSSEQDLLLPPEEDPGKRADSFEEQVGKDSNIESDSVGFKTGRGVDSTVANAVLEVDWDASTIREASVNVTRRPPPLEMDDPSTTTSSSHPRRRTVVGADILARLEQQLQDEGYEILRHHQEGPESMVPIVTVQEKRSKKRRRRSRRLGGGWYRIW